MQTLFTKGQTAIDQNRFDEAMTIYNGIASLPAVSPADAAVALGRVGKILMIQRKFELAVTTFQRSLKLNPSDAVVQNNLGEALGELKQFAPALEAFTKAAALDGTLLRARYNQGVTYARMGNSRYAEFMFRNLIKNNPTYSLGYDGLAVTLSRSGRAKEAIQYHEKALALNPNDASFYYNLALSYLMLGNTNKALEQQEKLKRIDPAIADRLSSVIIKHQM
ncbi:MAG TPA: tetratricopeptide repeat protein [Pyrinomonadaceae bacterium]|nr:tetratricopeptide repeat protein [Pyrinomonadaceae bacterium]